MKGGRGEERKRTFLLHGLFLSSLEAGRIGSKKGLRAGQASSTTRGGMKHREIENRVGFLNVFNLEIIFKLRLKKFIRDCRI